MFLGDFDEKVNDDVRDQKVCWLVGLGIYNCYLNQHGLIGMSFPLDAYVSRRNDQYFTLNKLKSEIDFNCK